MAVCKLYVSICKLCVQICRLYVPHHSWWGTQTLSNYPLHYKDLRRGGTQSLSILGHKPCPVGTFGTQSLSSFGSASSVPSLGSTGYPPLLRRRPPDHDSGALPEGGPL